MKKGKKKIKQKFCIYLSSGMSLQDIINEAHKQGAKDFNTVLIEYETVSGCSCPSDSDGYCYCESGYNDFRFEFYIDKEF